MVRAFVSTLGVLKVLKFVRALITSRFSKNEEDQNGDDRENTAC